MKSKIKFLLNDILIDTELNPATVLLDFVRSHNFTSAKEGCKEGDCGACTVICGKIENNKIKYRTINSCLVPVMNINGSHIVTLEGLNSRSGNLSPIQSSFLKEGASQCGFCTPGFIVSLTEYLLSNNFGEEILHSIDGNICRCTGHNSIIRAAENISNEFKDIPAEFDDRLKYLHSKNIIPDFFLNAKENLVELQKGIEPKNNQFNSPKYYISGGTDLFVQRPDDMLSSDVTFILKENRQEIIYEKDGSCFIDSTSTVTDIFKSDLIRKYFPVITEFTELFGSTPIRNSATLGGNINNASPIGDMTAFFMALDSDVILSDGSSYREVSLKDFYTGYKKTLRKSDEFVKSLKFKIPGGQYYFNFEKVSKRTYMDIASVNTAIYLQLEEDVISNINISAGGVFETPKFLSMTLDFLTGKKIEFSVIQDAVEIADSEILPISDARGSDVYKRLLLKRLIWTHFIKLFPELINIKETV
ncbi:MAG: FAD binding domain-containing protein [Ignavibacteria bacterium]